MLLNIENDTLTLNISGEEFHVIIPASGRGARVSACAGLINQLQRCQFDPRITCLENTDTVIVGDWWTGVGRRHALNC